MYGQVALRLTPLLMLRPSGRLLRWFAAALAAIAFALAVSFSSQDPDGCHSEKQASTPGQFIMAQTLSPTAVDLNQCPGGLRFSVGDFKFH
jgi:hypothetical protein